MKEQPHQNFSLAEAIKGGLREGIQQQKRGIRGLVFPEPPRSYFAKDVIALRESIGLSQAAFAVLLHVSVRAVQSWEQGERKPSQACARLLQLLEHPHLYSDYLSSLKRSAIVT